MNARKLFALVLAASSLSLTVLAAGESLVIAERGKAADYAIVIPVDAGESMRYAASELSSYARKMTGVELPVAESADDRK